MHVGRTFIFASLQAITLRAAANVPTDSAPATAAIPLQLAENYYALQNPAVLNMRYSQAVKVKLGAF